jgi:RNA polymerase sigma-54 factor
VAEAQSRFLAGGPAHLLPLTHREVAERVGVHESTVSRAGGAQVETPHGTFSLSHFFQSAVRSSEHTDMASEVARDAIASLVASEDPAQPLSDQGIVTLLSQRHGIEIARRTVSKYREQIGIPAAAQRRR